MYLGERRRKALFMLELEWQGYCAGGDKHSYADCSRVRSKYSMDSLIYRSHPRGSN